ICIPQQVRNSISQEVPSVVDRVNAMPYSDDYIISRVSGDLNGEVDWIASLKKNDAQITILKTAMATMIYHIWLARNGKIFENKILSPNNIKKGILHEVSLRLNLHCKNGEDNWGINGYGGLFGDSTGESLLAFAERVTPQSIIFHEMQPISRELSIAVELGITTLRVATDSTLMVSCIGDGVDPPWERIGLMKNIKRMNSMLQEFSIGHEYRECSLCADYLASYLDAGTQFWDEKLERELAEAEALVYGEAEGGENDENLFRSICLLLQPPLSVAQMSNRARWSILQSYNLLKWHKAAHKAAVKALESGSSLSVVIRRIEDAMTYREVNEQVNDENQTQEGGAKKGTSNAKNYTSRCTSLGLHKMFAALPEEEKGVFRAYCFAPLLMIDLIVTMSTLVVEIFDRHLGDMKMRRFPKKKNTYGLKEIDDALKHAKLERHQEDVPIKFVKNYTIISPPKQGEKCLGERNQIETPTIGIAPVIGAPAVGAPTIGSSSSATEIRAVVVRVYSQLEEHCKILYNHGKMLERISMSTVGDNTLPLGNTLLLVQYQFSTPEKIVKYKRK
ncbi:hypothetical protein GIB67_013605, partial [Kingdonia uniflora]